MAVARNFSFEDEAWAEYEETSRFEPFKPPRFASSARTKPRVRRHRGLIWARRKLDGEDKKRLMNITEEVLSGNGMGNVRKVRGDLGSSALTSAMAEMIVDWQFDGASWKEKHKKYAARVNRFIDEYEGATDEIYVQLGGAVILGATGGRSKNSLVAMEIVGQGGDQLYNESLALKTTLSSGDPGYLQSAGKFTPHITLATVPQIAAKRVQALFNESDAESMWVGLSALQAINSRR